MSATSANGEKAGELRLRIEELPASHAALAKALGELGIGGEKAHQLFAKAVTATCIGCDLTITGEELGQIAMAGGEHPTTQNKLDRLRLGYCGRLGCVSKFYNLHVSPTEGIDANALLRRAEKLRTEPQSEPPPEAEAGPKIPWWKIPRNRIVAGVSVIVLYLGWRIFGPDGAVPIVRRESPYRVETNEVPQAIGPVSGSGEVVR